MVYFALTSIIILLISFLLGALVLGVLKEKFSFIHTATPLGFIILIAIYQIGLVIANRLKLTNSITQIYLLIICILIIVLSLIKHDYIVNHVKRGWSHRVEILICIPLFILSYWLFSKNIIKLSLSDINFYVPFVKDGIDPNIKLPTYGTLYRYQGYYKFISDTLKWSMNLSKIGVYTDYLPVGYLLWVPTFIQYVIMPLTLVNLGSLFIKKMEGKWFSYFVVAAMIIFTLYSDWYLRTPYYGNAFRREVLIFLLMFLNDFHTTKDNKSIFICVALLLSFISFSSSGLFIGGIVLYGFLMYCGITKKENYLFKIAVIAIPLVLYATTFYSVILYLAIVVYLILILLKLFGKMNILEKAFNRVSLIIFIAIPLIMVIFTYTPFFHILTEFGDIPSFFARPDIDIVPDLNCFEFNSGTWTLTIFDSVYWIGMFLVCFNMIKGKKDLIPFVLLSTILTFFNPFVFEFVRNYLTDIAYFRINDILATPLVFLLISESFIKIKDNEKIKSIIAISLFCVSLCTFNNTHVEEHWTDGDDYNSLYHVPQSTVDIVAEFDDYLSMQSVSKSTVVASQVYGTMILSRYNLKNKVPRSGMRIEDSTTSNFETVFFRKMPGIEDNFDSIVDYKMACNYAYEKGIEYSIIDAQNNPELYTNLWPCVEPVNDEGNYRILKMNYDLWTWYVKEGQVEDLRPESLKNK